MEPSSPPPEPSGALVPPPRHPPTAVAADAPEPPRPSRAVVIHQSRTVYIGPTLRDLVNRLLDGADRAAEEVEAVLGIRR